jgi:hypothetical protein
VLAFEPVTERGAGLVASQQRPCRSVESGEVGDHAMKHGVTRCARLANSPFGELPLYSKSPRASLTLKLIVER